MHTQYDTQGLPHPQIIQMSQQELTSEYYAESPQSAPASGIDARIFALYAAKDGPHGTIYILHPTAVAGAENYENATDNPAFKEILLHELVHHVQWQNDAVVVWQCPRRGETEAYLLGAMYLKQQQMHDPLILRGFWANTYSQC